MSRIADSTVTSWHTPSAGSLRLLRTVSVIVVASLLAVGCDGSSETEQAGTSSSPERTPSATESDPLARPIVDGRFEVDRGRSLRMVCWGEGSPTVVLGVR